MHSNSSSYNKTFNGLKSKDCIALDSKAFVTLQGYTQLSSTFLSHGYSGISGPS